MQLKSQDKQKAPAVTPQITYAPPQDPNPSDRQTDVFLFGVLYNNSISTISK